MDFADYVKAVSDRELSVCETERFSHIAKLLQEAPNGKVYISMPPRFGRMLITNDMANQKCRICGCDWFHACLGGCWWVEDDLCSTCQEKLQRHWWGRLRLRLHRKRGA